MTLIAMAVPGVVLGIGYIFVWNQKWLTPLGQFFGRKEILRGINFSVEEGEIISVLGPSGCGKSTLLNIIAGILPLDGGTVAIHGQQVSAAGKMVAIQDRSINMVFQDFALWPHMKARENILYGLKVKKLGKEEMESRLNEVVSLLHLEGLPYAVIRVDETFIKCANETLRDIWWYKKESLEILRDIIQQQICRKEAENGFDILLIADTHLKNEKDEAGAQHRPPFGCLRLLELTVNLRRVESCCRTQKIKNVKN